MVPSQRSVWHIFLFGKLRKDEHVPKLLRFWVDALKGSWKEMEDQKLLYNLFRPLTTDYTFYALNKNSPDLLGLSPECSQYIEKIEFILTKFGGPLWEAISTLKLRVILSRL